MTWTKKELDIIVDFLIKAKHDFSLYEEEYRRQAWSRIKECLVKDHITFEGIRYNLEEIIASHFQNNKIRVKQVPYKIISLLTHHNILFTSYGWQYQGQNLDTDIALKKLFHPDEPIKQVVNSTPKRKKVKKGTTCDFVHQLLKG